MTINIKEEAFDVLHQNLLDIEPKYRSKEVILCPLCLTELLKSEGKKWGIEHIVPQNVVKEDPASLTGTIPKNLITKNRRSGITILCRRCNELKGKWYDRPIGSWLNGTDHETRPLSHRQYVAVLVMGYLGAFQTYGYGYILRPELNEIRQQFYSPDRTVTQWLAYIKILPGFHGVFSTEDGNPFIRLGLTHEDAALEMIFRKFWAVLPGLGPKLASTPKTLTTLLD